jgi:hypothetical protein
MSVDQFIAQLRGCAATKSVANPYNCYELGIDATPDVSHQRRLQLAAYLRHRLETAQVILVAEAPGYQGARFSGLAMTSERLLSGSMNFVTEQDILGQVGLFERTSHINASLYHTVRQRGFTEPTATVVWQELMATGQARNVVLWNTFPFHPHRAANRLSNRRPNAAGIAASADILVSLRALFAQDCQLVAVGNIARDYLQELGVQATVLRHPANGGAADFRAQFRQLVGFADLPN